MSPNSFFGQDSFFSEGGGCHFKTPLNSAIPMSGDAKKKIFFKKNGMGVRGQQRHQKKKKKKKKKEILSKVMSNEQ